MKNGNMTHLNVVEFENMLGKIQGLYEEITTLSKKSPNDCLNKFKAKLANGIIDKANNYFKSQKLALPIADFDHFDEESLPFNSDVVIVLSQYLQGLENIRTKHIVRYGNHWYWKIDGARSNSETFPPKGLK